MKIEDVILEIHLYECKHINHEIDFILVSEDNYVSLKREMVSEIRYGFLESIDIMKRPIMKIKGIDFSFHELIKGNSIIICGKNRI
jgi:hypothetical protein